MHFFEFIQQIVIGNDFLCLPCMVLGNLNCNHYMMEYRSNGFDVANAFNVTDQDRTDFWEVFDIGEVYDRNYIEEMPNFS